jgi:hypothetical protein
VREGKAIHRRDGRVTKAITDALPLWIREKDGTMELIPERAKVVRRIFALAAAGYGRSRIVQTLKTEGIPSFTGKREWSGASISFILSDGRARGVYQPCKEQVTNNKRKRIPDGPPIPDYYPAAVTEQEWLGARAGMAQRRRTLKVSATPWTEEEDTLVRHLSVGQVAHRTGRSRAAVYQRRHALSLTTAQKRHKEGNFVNVFAGLLHDALPPHSNFITVTRNDATGRRKALLNHAHAEGKAPCRLFSMEVFEKAVLGALREIDPREVLPPADTGPDEEEPLRKQLDAIEVELAEAAAFMEMNGFSPTIGQRVAALEKRKEQMAARLLDAKARAACPAQQAWGEYKSLLDALERASDPRDARLRLQGALRRIVDSAWLLIVPRGRDRLCAVQIWFAARKQHRDYLILNRLPTANGASRTAGQWRVRSLPIAIKSRKLDFRKPAHVQWLEPEMAALDLDGTEETE